MESTNRRFQTVIFDLDGTLLNTLEDLANSGNAVCRAHGWPEHPIEAYKYFVGNGMRNLVTRFVPEDWRTPERVQQVLDEFMPCYAVHKEDRTAPYDGIPALLKHLSSAGLEMAVLSNKAHSATAPIIEHYFPGVFPVVQGGLDGVPLKPDPALLHVLMDRMGADPARTLFVGDSDVDVRTAKNGGLAVCAVLWGFRKREELEPLRPDFFAETATALEEIVLHTPMQEQPAIQNRGAETP